jgi:HAD superfamily hydrolase (TIGR01509 family)
LKTANQDRSVARAVIFDMDGVLVDSEPVILAAAIAGLAEYGVSAQPDDFKPFVGAGEVRFIGGVAEKYGVLYRAEMKDRVYEIYLQIVDGKLKLYPHVNESLHRLHAAGWRLAVASSADRVKVDANLRVARIETELFQVVLSAEDVQHKKPDPEIYLLAAERLGIAQANAIVVEDAVNGIRAAHAAGMRCLALTTTFAEELLEQEHPEWIVADLAAAVDKILA